jgi:hypothetical protein
MPLTSDAFAQQIKAKYPQYASVDNATLTQKMLAKYPQYANRVQLGPAPAPTQNLGQMTAGQFLGAGQKIVSSVTDAGKKLAQNDGSALGTLKAVGAVGEGLLGAAAGGVQGLFAPVTAVTEKLFSHAPAKTPAYVPQGPSPLAPAINKVKSVAAAHPEATRNIMDALAVGSTALGGEAGLLGKTASEMTVPEAARIAVAPVKKAATSVVDAAKATKSAVLSPKATASKVVFGTPEHQAATLIDKRLGELSKLEDNSAPIRKATAAAAAKGIDSKKLLAQTDLLHGAVDDSGTLRTHDAISQLNDFIKPQEDVISANLAKEGVKIPLETVRKSLTTAIDKSGLEGDALEAGYNKLEATLKGLARRADSQGNISLSKLQDAKVSKYANLDYTNPASKTADKAIARSFKGLIEKNTNSVDVKALNKELSQHYAVQNLLEKLDGKKVDGGKLGKYFAKTVGAVVGGHFGPLGAIIGAEAAGKLKGIALARTLKGKTGAALETSEAMKNAVAKGKAPQLLLPAPPPGSVKVAHNLPIFLGAPASIEAPAKTIRRHVFKAGSY